MICFLYVSWQGKMSLSRQFFIEQFKSFPYHLIGVSLEVQKNGTILFCSISLRKLISSCVFDIYVCIYGRHTETNLNTLILQAAL